jgi:hypothetical protein
LITRKQADLLAGALAAVDVGKVCDLHMVQSGVVLPEHLDVFERSVAKRLDYAYSGPQSARIWRSFVSSASSASAGWRQHRERHSPCALARSNVCRDTVFLFAM